MRCHVARLYNEVRINRRNENFNYADGGFISIAFSSARRVVFFCIMGTVTLGIS